MSKDSDCFKLEFFYQFKINVATKPFAIRLVAIAKLNTAINGESVGTITYMDFVHFRLVELPLFRIAIY